MAQKSLVVIHGDSHLLYPYGWLIDLFQGSQIYITLIPRFENLSLTKAIWMIREEAAEVKSVHCWYLRSFACRHDHGKYILLSK